MNKALGLAIGLVVVAGGAFTATAWYTGTRIEDRMQGLIDQANKKAEASFAGTNSSVQLNLVAYERHIFTSTAHYRFKVHVQNAMDNRDLEFLLVSHIEHGPLPASHLKAGRFTPILLSSESALEKNPTTEKWFAVASKPFESHDDMDYSGAISGTTTFAPVSIAMNELTRLQTSAVKFTYSATPDNSHLQLKGDMDSVHWLDTHQDNPLKVDLQGLHLESDQHKEGDSMPLGNHSLDIASATVQTGVDPIIVLEKIRQTQAMQADGQNLAMQFALEVGQLTLGGSPAGSGKFGWSVKNIDATAAQTVFKTLQAQGAKTNPDEPAPAFADADKLQLQAGLKVLLAHKPEMTISQSLQTAHGAGSFNLALAFQAPASFDQPPAQVMQQLLASADSQLTLSKAMLGDLTGSKLQFAGAKDVQTIERVKSSVGDSIAGFLQARRLAVVNGDSINSTLHYMGDSVTFNGQVMSSADFMRFVQSAAMGAPAAQ